MGFFDTKVNDSFDEVFDLNRDGNLDIFEQIRKSEYLENELRKDRDDEDDEFEDELEDDEDDEFEDELEDDEDDEFEDELEDDEDDEFEDELDDDMDDEFSGDDFDE